MKKPYCNEEMLQKLAARYLDGASHMQLMSEFGIKSTRTLYSYLEMSGAREAKTAVVKFKLPVDVAEWAQDAQNCASKLLCDAARGIVPPAAENASERGKTPYSQIEGRSVDEADTEKQEEKSGIADLTVGDDASVYDVQYYNKEHKQVAAVKLMLNNSNMMYIIRKYAEINCIEAAYTRIIAEVARVDM